MFIDREKNIFLNKRMMVILQNLHSTSKCAGWLLVNHRIPKFENEMCWKIWHEHVLLHEPPSCCRVSSSTGRLTHSFQNSYVCYKHEKHGGKRTVPQVHGFFVIYYEIFVETLFHKHSIFTGFISDRFLEYCARHMHVNITSACLKENVEKSVHAIPLILNAVFAAAAGIHHSLGCECVTSCRNRLGNTSLR